VEREVTYRRQGNILKVDKADGDRERERERVAAVRQEMRRILVAADHYVRGLCLTEEQRGQTDK